MDCTKEFEVLVYKFRNSLCRVAIARNDRTSGVALFVDFREDVEATSLRKLVRAVRSFLDKLFCILEGCKDMMSCSTELFL